MKTWVILLIVCAASVQLMAVENVIWDGQETSQQATSIPEGRFLQPGFAYWHDTAFADLKVNFKGNWILPDGKGKPCSFLIPATGKLKAWLGEGEFVIDSACLYKLTEVALLCKGKGKLQIEDIYNGATPCKIENQLRIECKEQDTFWLRCQLSETNSSSKWRVPISKGLFVKAIHFWGEGDDSDVKAVYQVPKKFPVAYESLKGANKTTFSDHIYWSWRRPLEKDAAFKDSNAVWAEQPKWSRISSKPILPEHSKLNKKIKIVMTMNEYEGSMLSLTSLKDRIGKEGTHDIGIYKDLHPGIQNIEISLSPVTGPTPKKLIVKLRVAAMMRTQLWGTVVGPLFECNNMLPAVFMKKYFTNGSLICHYPTIALLPCASQLFWLEVNSSDAKPGMYHFSVKASTGATIPVEVKVLPIQLPTPKTWIHAWTWAATTTSWPFRPEGALEAQVSDKLSRGISSFNYVPLPGTEAFEARKQNPDVTFHYSYAVPGYWAHNGYGGRADLYMTPDPKKKAAIVDHVKAMVETYKQANVPYSQWCAELWDEPSDKNAELIKIAAKWVHDVDPKVRLYVNPSFPRKIESFQKMSDVADIFVPFWSNWFNGKDWQKELSSKHQVNAMYAIFGSCRSELNEELVGHYRILPWQAFKLGLNGWGFYSYYSPRGDPYTDYEASGKATEVDYQVVYPGPRAPVPSRQAEAFRDGWEDYRLLTYIREKGSAKAKAVMEQELSNIPMGREPLTAHIDFEAIRLRLLESLTSE